MLLSMRSAIFQGTAAMLQGAGSFQFKRMKEQPQFILIFKKVGVY